MPLQTQFPPWNEEFLLCSLNVFHDYLVIEWRHESGLYDHMDDLLNYYYVIRDTDTLFGRMRDTIYQDIKTGRLHLPCWIRFIQERPFTYEIMNHSIFDFSSRKVYK